MCICSFIIPCKHTHTSNCTHVNPYSVHYDLNLQCVHVVLLSLSLPPTPTVHCLDGTVYAGSAFLHICTFGTGICTSGGMYICHCKQGCSVVMSAAVLTWSIWLAWVKGRKSAIYKSSLSQKLSSKVLQAMLVCISCTICSKCLIPLHSHTYLAYSNMREWDVLLCTYTLGIAHDMNPPSGKGMVML